MHGSDEPAPPMTGVPHRLAARDRQAAREGSGQAVPDRRGGAQALEASHATITPVAGVPVDSSPTESVAARPRTLELSIRRYHRRSRSRREQIEELARSDTMLANQAGAGGRRVDRTEEAPAAAGHGSRSPRSRWSVRPSRRPSSQGARTPAPTSSADESRTGGRTGRSAPHRRRPQRRRHPPPHRRRRSARRRSASGAKPRTTSARTLGRRRAKSPRRRGKKSGTYHREADTTAKSPTKTAKSDNAREAADERETRDPTPINHADQRRVRPPPRGRRHSDRDSKANDHACRDTLASCGWSRVS